MNKTTFKHKVHHPLARDQGNKSKKTIIKMVSGEQHMLPVFQNEFKAAIFLTIAESRRKAQMGFKAHKPQIK